MLYDLMLEIRASLIYFYKAYAADGLLFFPSLFSGKAFAASPEGSAGCRSLSRTIEGFMEELSALNNSSITDEMSLEDILAAADERIDQLNDERTKPTASDRAVKDERWLSMLETARALLPSALRIFVHSARETHREDQPNEVAVAIDLPGCARIFFGPWTYDEALKEFKVEGMWRNKPFQVAGGNMEEFGDLLDAIARAREVYRMWLEREAH
jgi:hypothetical protein